MFVKPAKPHLVIRDPRSKVRLPADGARVPDTTYWRRRVMQGDCLELTANEFADAMKARTKAKAKVAAANARPKAPERDKPEVPTKKAER